MPPLSSGRARAALVACALVAAAFALYWPARRFGFVDYDDYRTVVWNPLVQGGFTVEGVRQAFGGPHLEFWIPLTWLSHQLEVSLLGMDAGRFHLTNAGLHAAGAVLLFFALRSLTGALWPSAATAALLAVHPLHVEPVAWITGRKDVLSAALGFASLAGYAGWVRGRRPSRYAFALLAFAASLLAKPALITLPLLLLVLDWWPLGRLRGRGGAVLLEKAPFALLSLASAAATLLARGGAAAASASATNPSADRLANAAGATLFYLKKAVLPSDLATPYPPTSPLLGPVAAAGVALLLAAATAAAITAARRAPHATAGWLWYLACLLPAADLVPTGKQLVADRYAYAALPGVYLLVAWTAAAAARRRPLRRVVVVALLLAALVALAAGARHQLGFWRSGESLSRRALAVTRDNWIAMVNLGTTLLEAGDPAGALELYRRALAIRPGEGTAHADAGLALARLGRHAEAAQFLERAWALGFREARAEVERGRSLLVIGDVGEAEGAFRRALALEPDNADAREGIARAAAAGGPGALSP